MIDPTEVFVPRSIGRFVFESDIGIGSFALVKTVRDTKTNEVFACKIVPKEKLYCDELVERFEQEIRVMQQMKHQNIAQLYEIIKDELNYYIIMEFCPNGELFQVILDRKMLPEYESKVYLAQVVEALQYVHKMNACHRDLKPENLLIGENGVLKIADFGFSRFTPNGTLCETACGSPCYVSPECLAGEPYDGSKSDIWSAGVIFFVMCTGKLPWTKRNQKRLFEQIMKGEYAIPKHLSEECKDLIQSMMCVDPERRISAKEILKHPWMQDAIQQKEKENFKNGVSLKTLDIFFDRDCNMDYSIEVDESEFKTIKSSRGSNFQQMSKMLKTTKKAMTETLPPLSRKTKSVVIQKKAVLNQKKIPLRYNSVLAKK